MEDYIRGVLCGYLQVQNGTLDNAKRKRTFVVLSDSRMDYYLTDPRPTFAAKIDATYFLTDTTRVHYYLELNARAPPNSICLTTNKTTDVYIADSQEEADIWFRHLTERLDALSTMLKGFLMLRKELPATQQVKRFVLRTKYRWKARHVELGRSTLRFCKQSDHKTKTMKQFTLTATSFAGQESTTYLRQLSVLASYSIPVDPTPQTLKGIKKIEKLRREEENRNQVDNADKSIKSNEVRPRGSSVAAFYPFIVTTGQAYILLAAPTEQTRTHWILAIRLRIIALKYRHNGGGGPRKQPGHLEANPYQLQSFVEAQPKPGGPWKQHYVELDNGMLRVKKSERKLGSIFEVQLVPTCRITPLLDKANAFTVRSLGCEVAFAPGSAAEARRWMELIQSAAAAVDRARYQRIFHDDIQVLLRHSIVYALDVASEAKADIVLEKHKKRIFVLSHEPAVPRSPKRVTMAALVRRVSMLATATSSPTVRTPPSSGSASPINSRSAPATAETAHPAAIIPRGSVLVGISQFGMMHDSADTIWHTLRQKKGCYKQAKRLLFRAPAVKEGFLRVKFRAADEWVLHKCRLANGLFRVEDTQSRLAETLVEVALRDCEVELFSDDDCVNGIKLIVTTNGALMRTVVFMNIAVDDDAFLWFAMLHMEICVAQGSLIFPLNAALLRNTPVSALATGTASVRDEKLAADQAKSHRDCTVMGTRVEEIEKYSREHELLFLSIAAKDREKKEADPAFDSLQQEKHQAVESSAVLSSADFTNFFQHLDAVGSGQVSSAGLAFTMKLITKHIRSRTRFHDRFSMENEERLSASSSSEPLVPFIAALEAFSSGGRDGLSPEEFATIMAKVTHPTIVELVRKESRNDIQCI